MLKCQCYMIANALLVDDYKNYSVKCFSFFNPLLLCGFKAAYKQSMVIIISVVVKLQQLVL